MFAKHYVRLAFACLVVISVFALRGYLTAQPDQPPGTTNGSSKTNRPAATPPTAEDVAAPLLKLVDEIAGLRAAVVKAEAAEKESSKQYGVIYDASRAHQEATSAAERKAREETERAYESTAPVKEAFAPAFAAKAEVVAMRAKQKVLDKDVDAGAEFCKSCQRATRDAIRARFDVAERLQEAARKLLYEDCETSASEVSGDALLIVVKKLADVNKSSEKFAERAKAFVEAHQTYVRCAKAARETAAVSDQFNGLMRRRWALQDKMFDLLEQPYSSKLDAELESARKEARELATFREKIDAANQADSETHQALRQAQEARMQAFQMLFFIGME